MSLSSFGLFLLLVSFGLVLGFIIQSVYLLPWPLISLSWFGSESYCPSFCFLSDTDLPQGHVQGQDLVALTLTMGLTFFALYLVPLLYMSGCRIQGPSLMFGNGSGSGSDCLNSWSGSDWFLALTGHNLDLVLVVSFKHFGTKTNFSWTGSGLGAQILGWFLPYCLSKIAIFFFSMLDVIIYFLICLHFFELLFEYKAIL